MSSVTSTTTNAMSISGEQTSSQVIVFEYLSTPILTETGTDRNEIRDGV